MNIIKKNIKLLIFLLVCFSIYLIYDNKHEDKYNYVSLGDGYAMGINSYNKQDYGYNLYLKDYLQENNLLKTFNPNFSYQEITINELKKDILLNITDKDNNNIKRTLRESNLLTVSVGLNDLIYQIVVNKDLNSNKKQKIINNISGNLADLIREIRKYYKRNIYVIGYYNFYPQNSVEKELLEELNNKYKSISSKENFIFIDTNNNQQYKYKYLDNQNSIYPNAYGYEQIFRNILEKITK